MRYLLSFSLHLCAFLLFLSPSNAQWQWGVNAINSFSNEGEFTKTDASGNVFLAGVNWDDPTVIFGTDTIYDLAPVHQIVIGKTDPSGHFLWGFGTQYSKAVLLNIAVDGSGDVLLYGYYEGDSLLVDTVMLYDTLYADYYFLAKISPSGHVLWAKNVSPMVPMPSWGMGIYNNGGMGIDNLGNVYINGNFWVPSISIGSYTLPNHGFGGNFFIAKYSGAGGVIWAKAFGGTNTDYPGTLAVNSTNGDFYVHGSLTSTGVAFGTHTLYGSGAFLARFDSSGYTLNALNVDNVVTVNAMTVDANDNLYITGSISSYDIMGTDTLTNMGGDDFCLCKYDTGCHVVWARSAGGTNNDEGWGITLSPCNKIWVSGSLGAYGGAPPHGYTMNFNGNILAAPAIFYQDPMFIATYDLNGHFDTAIALASGGDDLSGLTTDNTGNLFVVGDMVGATEIFGSDTLTISTGMETLFLVKYHDTCIVPGDVLNVRPMTTEDMITLYPNPTSSSCIIHCPGVVLSSATATVYDVTGRLMHSFSLSGSNTTISVTDLPSGMYLCRIDADGQKVVTKKLVVMR